MIAILASIALLAASPVTARTAHTTPDTTSFTHADTLRGDPDSPGRVWWDVKFYDLNVLANPADSSLRGYDRIAYKVVSASASREMQIDLMMPLEVDSIVQDRHLVSFRRDSNAFFAKVAEQRAGEQKWITVYYHGKPRVAKHAPWDGGIVWTRDSLGVTSIASAAEGTGASLWWPNKDTQADEPDSARIAITVPSDVQDVSNGRLRSKRKNTDGTTTYEWFVASPINNYDIAINAGNYAHYADTLNGEQGKLSLDFWPLAYHLAAAKKQFPQAKTMLKCFEGWFGPYPWYRDGYKLVETPHLGMEHQSGIAYGNHYQNGYLGRDRSRSGLGLHWDFIIVHESAHEWWGNNITARDLADLWIHESFATYAEALYTECQEGKAAGAQYIIGDRKNVRNDRPIIGSAYGVNAEGSGDMYDKGGNMLHTMRQIVNDDAKWREMLRGLNREFYHKVVTGAEVQAYIDKTTGVDFSRVFAQYLTTTKIPVFEYKMDGATLSYRWADAVPGFDMPVRVTTEDGVYTLLRPAAEWQTTTVKLSSSSAFKVDENFYVIPRDMNAPVSTDTTQKPGGCYQGVCKP